MTTLELEKKFQKYARYCQCLEEEKTIIKKVIKKYTSDRAYLDVDEDYTGSVENLLEKLVSMEEECNELSSADNLATAIDQISNFTKTRNELNKIVKKFSGEKKSICSQINK